MCHSHRLFAASILVLFSVLLVPTRSNASTEPTAARDTIVGPPDETVHQRDSRMQWWRDARFGLFIHWGPFAVPDDGEWHLTDIRTPAAEYERYAARFNPVKFDADKIASVAETAGQKYLVITAKHHDGFCMFKTATTKYNIVEASPWHQDPLAQLSAACNKHDLRFCCYYSIMDYHSSDQLPATPDALHPVYNPTCFPSTKAKAAYIRLIQAQLAEIITQYHPALIWFDGEWMNGWTMQDGRDLAEYAYKLDPRLIINGRSGGGGDFSTPEQSIPGRSASNDWETCMTIGKSWWFRQNDTDLKTAKTLLRNLIDIASKGGNYLLNVGPTAEGEIPQPEIDRLTEMGTWLKTNGAAIYGTKASPFAEKLDWGRATCKGNTLYLEVFTWPKDGKLTVPLATPVAKAYLLSEPSKALTTTAADGLVEIDLPGTAGDPVATVIAVECNGEPMEK